MSNVFIHKKWSSTLHHSTTTLIYNVVIPNLVNGKWKYDMFCNIHLSLDILVIVQLQGPWQANEYSLSRLKANNSFNYYVLHKQNLLGVRMTVLMVFIKFARGLERVFNMMECNMKVNTNCLTDNWQSNY